MVIHVDLIRNNIKPDIDDEDNEPETKYITTIFSFSIDNCIKISNIIKNIPYYRSTFDIMTGYEFIKIGQMYEHMLENECFLENADKKYIICKYEKQKRINFDNFLFSLSSPNRLIFHVLESYSYILSSLRSLNERNICFYDVCPNNICFCNNGRPFLRNYENSILTDQINEAYITNIIGNTIDYTHKPFEIHVLFYLIVNKQNHLNEKLIDVICRSFIKNLVILDLFSQDYKEQHLKSCVEFLRLYINKPTSEIIPELLKYCDKWDTYSISMLYLHLIGNITRVFSLKGTIMTKLISLLTKNIHPNPNAREGLKHTQFIYDKLFQNYTDWTFADTISSDKMDKLHEMLMK
jgi:hypothetical protein